MSRRTILLLGLLGALLGLVVGQLRRRARAIPWRNVGAPPGGAQSLLGAGYASVWIRGGDGIVFRKNFQGVSGWRGDQWPPEGSAVHFDSPDSIEKYYYCTNYPIAHDLPEEVVEIFEFCLQDYREEVAYKIALDNNGNVWRHVRSVFLGTQMLPLYDLLGYLAFACLGTLLGFAVGGLAYLVRWIQDRFQRNHT